MLVLPLAWSALLHGAHDWFCLPLLPLAGNVKGLFGLVACFLPFGGSKPSGKTKAQ